MALTQDTTRRRPDTTGELFITFDKLTGEKAPTAALVDQDGEQSGIETNPLQVREAVSILDFSDLPNIHFELTKDGLGADNQLADEDGSVTPVKFWMEVPVGKEFLLDGIVVQAKSPGAAIDADNFLSGSGLANGVKFEVYDTDHSTLLFDFDNISSNHQFLGTGSVLVDPFHSRIVSGTINTKATAILSLRHLFFGGPLLRLTAGQFIQATVQDDLATHPVTEMVVAVNGVMRSV